MAVAGAPAGASFEVTVLVVLVCTPISVPVTFTEKVHAVPAARVAPDRLMVFDPALAVIVPPPHEPVSPLGVDTTRPDGIVSVNASPVSGSEFGFVIVKLRAVLLLGPNNCESANALVILGGVGNTTVRLAVEVFPVSPPPEKTWTLLFFTPAVVPTTFTLNVQDVPAATVAPDRLMVLDPATAVGTVPLQPVGGFRPLGVDTIRPEGSVSVKPTPLNAAAAFGFVIVKLRAVVPLSGIVGPPNALVMVGGRIVGML